jgi:hypothetical protein
MDATRKAGTFNRYAFYLFFHIDHIRIHRNTNIITLYHSFCYSPCFIIRLYHPLLPARKRRAKMVSDFQSNQAAALITVTVL